MPRARFLAHWDMRKVREAGLHRGEMLLDVLPRYYKAVRKVAERLQAWQKKPDGTYEPLEIEVTLDAQRKPRTLDQNRLMWALYGAVAAELNGGIDDPEKEITPEKLYEDDMRLVAPTVGVTLRASELPQLEQIGFFWRRALPIEGTDLVTAEVVRTSSKWSTLEMARHIDGLFARLAYMGVNIKTSADLHHWWMQWRQDLDRRKVVVDYDEQVGKARYRELTPSCEGCGQFVGEAGEVHHIRTRGAGGAEPGADRPANWLHLCAECHGLWNAPGGGAEAFLGRYPHCATKVNRALGREEAKADGDH